MLGNDCCNTYAVCSRSCHHFPMLAAENQAFQLIQHVRRNISNESNWYGCTILLEGEHTFVQHAFRSARVETWNFANPWFTLRYQKAAWTSRYIPYKSAFRNIKKLQSHLTNNLRLVRWLPSAIKLPPMLLSRSSHLSNKTWLSPFLPETMAMLLCYSNKQ